MRYIAFLVIFIASALADFSLTYKISNIITQKVDFKDKENVLFTIKQSGNTVEKLIISDGKKYISFNDNGIEQILEISDELSEPVKTEVSNDIKYKVIKKEQNLKIAGFDAEKWTIQYLENNRTEDVFVSKDPKIVSAVLSVIEALKKILPNNKQKNADIFNMGNGYVLLGSRDLQLISYEEKPLPKKLFAIDTELNEKEEKVLSENIKNCFTKVCCGQKIEAAQELASFLNKNIENWKLKEVAKCKAPQEAGLESALYTDSNRSIIIEITTNGQQGGKIESLKKQGLKLVNIRESRINGFKITTAYLPIVNATIADIMLPSGTISIYCKGKSDLSAFAKKAIKLKLNQSYSSSSI